MMEPYQKRKLDCPEKSYEERTLTHIQLNSGRFKEKIGSKDVIRKVADKGVWEPVEIYG